MSIVILIYYLSPKQKQTSTVQGRSQEFWKGGDIIVMRAKHAQKFLATLTFMRPRPVISFYGNSDQWYGKWLIPGVRYLKWRCLQM